MDNLTIVEVLNKVDFLSDLFSEKDDDKIRRKGRTTILFLAFIKNAILNPKKEILIIDHILSVTDKRYVKDIHINILKRMIPKRYQKLFKFDINNNGLIAMTFTPDHRFIGYENNVWYGVLAHNIEDN